MTKSDVKKYIFDLITLSYIRTTIPEEPQNNTDHLRTGMASAETTRITEATRTNTDTTSRASTRYTTSSTRTETSLPEETTISMVKTDV